MKKIIQIISFLVCYLWVVLVGWSQDKPKFILSTNPIDWQSDIANVQLEVFPLEKLSIVGYANHFNSNIQTASVNQGIEGYSLGGQLRYYLFGNPQKISLFTKNKSTNKWGCPNARSFQKRRNHNLSGIFFYSGYEIQTSERVYQSNTEFEVEDLNYTINNNGITLGLGYQISIENLSIGINYGAKFSQPNWEGPIDIFGDSLYSITMPIPLRIENQFKLNVGLSF